MKTVVLVPSRGRIQNFIRMMNSIDDLSAIRAYVLAGIDDDDPNKDEYVNMVKKYRSLDVFIGPRDSLSGWTNFLAKAAISTFGIKDTYLVSMGDDHKVKSSFWDMKLYDAIKRLDGPGFSYGDDMFNGSGLCTSWMTSAKVVEALGWMMMPQCNHMYVDNAIMELGKVTKRISYVPSVIIEHLHPAANKAEIDLSYVESSSLMSSDLESFKNWRFGEQFNEDVRKINELRW